VVDIKSTTFPQDKQFTVLPESGFGDRFFSMSESMLVQALMSNNRGARGNPASVQHFLGRIQARAVSHVVCHPGDLIYNFFFFSTKGQAISATLV
jgi:hypothetical protein